jgi:hypothetical protein
MKRRNEDDVGPVQNGISSILPRCTPKVATCGKAVDNFRPRAVFTGKHNINSLL